MFRIHSCARSHYVLPGVAGDGRLGGTRIQEGSDAAELGGRKATVDLDLGCKLRMVHRDNTRDEARSLIIEGLGVLCSVPCGCRH